MKTIRQLFRQPGKTLSGVVLVALSVSILSVGVGQSLAARITRGAIEYQFNTVALPTHQYNCEEFTSGSMTYLSASPTYPQDIAEWIDRAAAEHPDLVQMDSRAGLASAYLPDLTADNYTRYEYYDAYQFTSGGVFVPKPLGAPYTCAMLEITLTSVEKETIMLYKNGAPEETETGGWIVSGTVDRVLSLQEGYHDPTGWTLHITLGASLFAMMDLDPEQAQREIAALAHKVKKMEPGQRYLVYGTNYYDGDWELRENIRLRAAESGSKLILDEFDLSKLALLSDQEIERNKAEKPTTYAVARYLYFDLTKEELRYVQGVTLKDPELVPLEGTAEEFLASAEGTRWREHLDIAQVNNHAFPLIGVDKLGYIGPFAQQNARVVEGRDFTQEELAGGTKVCVMAQSLAAANGLSVGDTLSVRYYDYDSEMAGQSLISNGFGTTEPTAYFYGESTPFSGEEETYTIVGLYRYNSEWGDPEEDLYAFTPNTIFVPKTSVTGTMDYSDQAFFRTIVLKNGTLPQFMALTEEAGYEGLFVYYDQGYSEISESFYDYQTAARRAMLIGVGLYCVLLALFLILFPARQGSTLNTMDSLGAGRKQKLSWLIASSLGILLPATVIGAIAGLLLWGRVSDALTASAQVMVEVQADVGGMLLVSVVQLAAALCAVLLLAIPMTKRTAMNRK